MMTPRTLIAGHFTRHTPIRVACGILLMQDILAFVFIQTYNELNSFHFVVIGGSFNDTELGICRFVLVVAMHCTDLFDQGMDGHSLWAALKCPLPMPGLFGHTLPSEHLLRCSPSSEHGIELGRIRS